MKIRLFTVFWVFLTLVQGQAQSSKLDSLRAVSKARTDSIKAVQAARRDSLQQVRQERERIRKEKELERREGMKDNPDSYNQLDFSRADSLRMARRDSLKQVREEEQEKRKRAQEAKSQMLNVQRRKKPLPLTQSLGLGYRLNSDGWSVFATRGFDHEEGGRSRFFTIDISEKRHPKETRIQNETFAILYPNEIKPIPYKYGKINNFYQLKLGYGASQEFSGRLDRKSVVIHWVYTGGLSLGLLKPYYLDLLVPEGNGYVRKFQKFTPQNQAYFLDLNNQGTILGGSYFTRGLGDLTLQPGLFVRSGFYFDYATTRKSFLGVEIGASAEVYTQTIPIMATTGNSSYFLNFYADFRIGRRWE